MQVENIECQIAQAQIGNFLSGSGLSDEAMQQLEEHISGCPACKAALAEKRGELKAMLNQKHAVVDPSEIFRETEEQQAAKSIAAALRKKTLQQLTQPAATVAAIEIEPEPIEIPAAAPAPVKSRKKAEKVEKPAKPVKAVKAAVEMPAPTAKPNNWKPLAYSGALAAVLVGMSLFSNNFASIFGPKLSETTDLTKGAASTVASKSATDKPANPAPTTTTNTAPTNTGTTDVPANPPATAINPATPTTETTTTPATQPVTEPASDPIEPTQVGDRAGAAIGALSTTQFNTGQTEPSQAPATSTPVKPVQPTTPKPEAAKPVVKAKPTRTIAHKRPAIKRRASIKRASAKRIKHAAARKHGITIYQP